MYSDPLESKHSIQIQHHQPRDEVRRSKAMIHELAGLAVYYLGGAGFLGDEATTSTP